MARKYRFRKFQAESSAHRVVLSCIMSGRDDVPFRRTLPAPIRSVAYFRNRYFLAISAVGGGVREVCGGKGLRLAEISPVGRSGFAEVFRFGRIGRERPGCGTGRRRRRETGLPIGEIPAENPRAAGCSCCKMTHGIAKASAESEFERYRVTRDRLCESDFDKTAQLALFGDPMRQKDLKKGSGAASLPQHFTQI